MRKFFFAAVLILVAGGAQAASYRQNDSAVVDPIQTTSGTDHSYSGANLQPFANLTSADLNNANLSSALLTNAELDSANLTNANLTDVNLTNASLWLADMSDVNLSSANLNRLHRHRLRPRSRRLDAGPRTQHRSPLRTRTISPRG